MARTKKGLTELKSSVRRASSVELEKLVIDLCNLSDDNRAFVEARLGQADDSLRHYKQIIDDSLYPDVFSNKPIRIAEARRAIADYKRAAVDPDGLLDLMMHYVERGTAFSADYGDIDEKFYASLESMYDRVLTALEKSGDGTRERFRIRAQAVVMRAQKIGWGYCDYVADRFAETYTE